MIERRLHTTRVFTTALPAPLLFRGWISGLLVRGFAVCPRAREVQGQAVLAVLAVLGRNAQQAARCALRVAPRGCARCGASAAALYLPARAGPGGFAPDGAARRIEMALRIYGVAIEMVRELRPLMERIGRRDSNLADQL